MFEGRRAIVLVVSIVFIGQIQTNLTIPKVSVHYLIVKYFIDKVVNINFIYIYIICNMMNIII